MLRGGKGSQKKTGVDCYGLNHLKAICQIVSYQQGSKNETANLRRHPPRKNRQTVLRYKRPTKIRMRRGEEAATMFVGEPKDL